MHKIYIVRRINLLDRTVEDDYFNDLEKAKSCYADKLEDTADNYCDLLIKVEVSAYTKERLEGGALRPGDVLDWHNYLPNQGFEILEIRTYC